MVKSLMGIPLSESRKLEGGGVIAGFELNCVAARPLLAFEFVDPVFACRVVAGRASKVDAEGVPR